MNEIINFDNQGILLEAATSVTTDACFNLEKMC
jgi:hypothetical protein